MSFLDSLAITGKSFPFQKSVHSASLPGSRAAVLYVNRSAYGRGRFNILKLLEADLLAAIETKPILSHTRTVKPSIKHPQSAREQQARNQSTSHQKITRKMGKLHKRPTTIDSYWNTSLGDQ